MNHFFSRLPVIAWRTSTRSDPLPHPPIHPRSLALTSTQAQDENKKLGRGEGVFVTGLILEGASWRNSKLNELQQKDREINFPTLWFGGIEKRSEDLSQYQCPIYKSRDRTGTPCGWWVGNRKKGEGGVCRRGLRFVCTCG